MSFSYYRFPRICAHLRCMLYITGVCTYMVNTRGLRGNASVSLGFLLLGLIVKNLTFRGSGILLRSWHPTGGC